MTPEDFHRIALSFPGTEAGSHRGAVDFRVDGRIFATLASVKLGYGNLMLTPTLQAEFLADRPDVFLPVAGGWGRMGMTHIRLAESDDATLEGALHTAWKRRLALNKSATAKKAVARKRKP